MKTFADTTQPNGKNVDAKSVSVNSCGRWYMNKLQPSGPIGAPPTAASVKRIK